MTNSNLDKRKLVFIGLAVAVAAFTAWRLYSLGGGGKPPQAVAPVVVAVAAKEKITDSYEALGTTRANESIRLTSKVTETVDDVKFHDGMDVAVGQEIVLLNRTEEQAAVAEAEATLANAQLEYARAQTLVKTKSVPKSQLDERDMALKTAQARLEAARARLEDRVVRAPFAGVLGLRMVSPGTLVEPGALITTLDDIRTIKLDFTVPEIYLAAVKPGLSITGRSKAFPGRDFIGKVAAINSRVDPATRAVSVLAELANEDRVLRPGMLLDVDVLTPPREAVVIPESAIVPVESRHFVYTLQEDGTVKQVDVTLGRREPGKVEIREGLVGGEKIVVEGTLRLKPGAKVKVQ